MALRSIRAMLLTAALCLSDAQAAPVVADGVSVDFGCATLRIPHIEAEGTQLSNADIARLFDAKDAATLDERLTRLNATRLHIPEIRVEAKTADCTVNLVYRDVTLDNVTQGRAASLRAASLERKSGLVLRENDLAFKNADLRQFARALTAAKADDKEPPKPVAEEGSIGALSLTDPDDGTELRASDLRVTGLSLRPLTQPLLRPSAAAIETPVWTALLAADALGAAEFKSFEAHGVEATLSPHDGPDAIKLKRLAIEGFAGAKARRIAAEDFSFRSADGASASLKSFALEGLDTKALATEDGWRALRFERLRLDDLAVDLPDEESKGRIKMRAGAVAADLEAFRAGVPTKAALRLDRYVLDLAANPDDPATAQLRALGYKQVAVSASLDALWREEAQELHIEKLQANGDDIGVIDLGGDIRGLNPSLLAASPLVAKVAALGARATRLEASVDAAPFIDRTLALEAKTGGGDAAKLRDSYARDAATIVTGTLENGAKAHKLGDAVAKAIRERKKLQLKLDAPQGVGLLDALKGPGALFESIEVEAAAE